MSGRSLLPLHDGIVYGPVTSRRFGRSLGINLLPPGIKLCNLNCSYCQYGWTTSERALATAWPDPHATADAVACRLRATVPGGRIDRLTIAGHGEPTMHPRFAAVVDALCAVRDAEAPELPIAILSNSLTVNDPSIRTALQRLDERYMKLDAGDPATVRRINGVAFDVERIAAGLAEVPRIVVQSMFVRDQRGLVDNTTDPRVGAWLRQLDVIHPMGVQVMTLDRAPASRRLRAVDDESLESIARRVRARGMLAEAITTERRAQRLEPSLLPA